MPLPKSISKKELIHVLQCYYTNGNVAHYKLNRYHMTVSFVEGKLGIPYDRYKKMRRFDNATTQKIYEHLQITDEDYEAAYPTH